jgi:hypothetical protein
MLLSTNPIAAAIPGGGEQPIVLDMATTVAAYGKVKTKALHGETMPEGWMIDREGKPLTDPKRAEQGMLLPLGGMEAGYKGYGLAMIIGLLAGTLGGAAMGRDVIDFNHDDDSVTNSGQAIAAINIAAMRRRMARKRERKIGDGVTISEKVPANQAGQGAASSSTESAAQTEFDKAKQSAMAEKPTSTAQERDKESGLAHHGAQYAAQAGGTDKKNLGATAIGAGVIDRHPKGRTLAVRHLLARQMRRQRLAAGRLVVPWRGAPRAGRLLLGLLGARVALRHAFLDSPSSISICSISRSSFSEERPNRVRRSTASCALRCSICSVLA